MDHFIAACQDLHQSLEHVMPQGILRLGLRWRAQMPPAITCWYMKEGHFLERTLNEHDRFPGPFSKDLLSERQMVLIDPALSIVIWPSLAYPQIFRLGKGPAATPPPEQPYALLLSHIYHHPQCPTAPMPWIGGTSAEPLPSHLRLSIFDIQQSLPRIPGLHTPWDDESRVLVPFEGGLGLFSSRNTMPWKILGLYAT